MGRADFVRKVLNHCLAVASLLVVPAVYGFAESFKVITLRGTFGEFVDPDAAYYIASVNLLAHNQVHFVLHPGIGILYLGSAVLAVATAALYPGPLGQETLLHFNELMQILRLSVVLVAVAAAIGAGALVWRATKDRASGIALQLGLFGSAASLTYGGRLMPESLLIGIAIMLVAVTHSAIRAGFARPGLDVAAAVLVGLGLATKILFAPFLLLYPIAAGLHKRAHAVYWVGVSLSLLLLVWPLHSELSVFSAYIKEIVAHRGPYGSGLPGFLDLGLAATALTNLARDYGMQLAAAFVAFVVGFVYRRSDPGAFRILLAVSAVLCSCMAMIAKQYAAYYLVPAFAMVPFMVAVAFANAPFSARVGVIAWRLCALVLVLSSVVGPTRQALGWYKGALAQNADEDRVVSALGKLNSSCFLAPSYSVGMFNYPIVFGFSYGARLDDQISYFDKVLKDAFGGIIPNYDYFEQKVFRPGKLTDLSEFVGPNSCAAVVSSYPLSPDSPAFRGRTTDMCKVGGLNVLLIQRTCEDVGLPRNSGPAQVRAQ